MSKNHLQSGVSRRHFLQKSGATLAAVSVLPAIITCAKEPLARGLGEVVLAHDQAATTGLDSIHEDIVQQLVDKAVTAFTGLSDVGNAWKSIFPQISINTVIGLKINCVAGTRPKQLCTQTATTQAIVNGLTQIKVRGGLFPAENIVIWERWDDEMEGAGYTINETGQGAKVIGISKTMEDENPKYGYDGEAPWTSMEDTAYFTTILSKMCDYQINVPVLKSIGRGVTFAMKNMYGTFSSEYPNWADIGTVYHKEFDTRICDLNAAPLIREKFILHVGDAILGMKARGPAGHADFAYGGIVMSKDPVALDAVGVKIIREQGQELEFRKFMTMAEERGLGIADLDKIKITYV